MPVSDVSMVRLFGRVDVECRATDDAPRSFSMVAYTGAVVDLGDDAPWIFDLDGIEIEGGARPILRNHDAHQIVGHGTATRTASGIEIAGTILRGELFTDAQYVEQSSDQGFPWQASVGLEVIEHTRLGEGEAATVNGRRVEGPMNVGARTRLNESSFVPLGADGATSAVVLRRKVALMDEPEKKAPEAPPEEEVEMTADKVAAWMANAENAAAVAALMEDEEEPEPEAPAEEEEELASVALSRAIREAFPNDPGFALEQICEGATLESAKAAYGDVVAAKLARAEQRIAELERKQTPSGARAIGTATTGTPKVDLAADRSGKAMRELARAEVAAGKYQTITAALSAISRNQRKGA